MINGIFTWFFGFAVGALLSWTHAHQTVATECQRLGSFYVGEKTYECKEKKWTT